MILDQEKIMDLLPHRPPFLFVDGILELTPGERAVGIKTIKDDDIFLTGHFPGNPIMPGVLMIEALAQVGACALLSHPTYAGRMAYLAGADGFRFRRHCLPGDTLTISVEITRLFANLGKGRGEIRVGPDLVASGEIMFALDRRTESRGGGC